MAPHNPWTRRNTGVHPPMLRESLVEMIGNTPLVRLNHLTSHLPDAVEIWVKLEYFNPSGSIKDRPARQIIVEALATGQLGNGQTLLDATSGNSGEAYAMLGAALEIPVTLVTPADLSPCRQHTLEIYGAKLVHSDPALGSDGARALAKKLHSEADPGTYFHADQYSNPANPLSHALTTAAEIHTQTHERVTHFVACMGTSGTVIGTGRGLKERDPTIKVYGGQPATARHGMEGIRHMDSSHVPEIYDPAVLDGLLTVTGEQGRTIAHELATREGILSGESGGANVWLAIELAKTLERGLIVTTICDHHDRHMRHA